MEYCSLRALECIDRIKKNTSHCGIISLVHWSLYWKTHHQHSDGTLGKTDRVSPIGIKRLRCWYKMLQAFRLKLKPQGQVASSVMLWINTKPLTRKNWKLKIQTVLARSCSCSSSEQVKECGQGRGCDVIPLSLPVTWPWSCRPCYSHSLKPGWRRFTLNRWEGLKEDTSAVAVGGGDFEMRCIDQNRTYSLGHTWQHRSHCGNMPALCQTVLLFFYLAWT